MSIRSITLAFLILVVFISAKAQDCEKEISTNPVNPYNNHPFPFNRYNPWLNTGFNIGETENGFALGETQRLLTIKVEELTLYLLQMSEEMNALREEITTLRGEK